MGEKATSTIFKDCIFAIIIRGQIDQKQATHLKEQLEQGDGLVKTIGFDSIQDFDDLTHIISATVDFPKYDEAQDCMIPVVTSTWIIQSLIRGKQAPLRPFTPDPKLFCSNVNLTCADIPSGDKDAIIGAVLAMGGTESSSLTKMTTHICALTMDHPKCQQAIEKGLKVKIVLPHWFDDCFKLGTRVDEKPYLLPNPEILSKAPEDDMLIPSSNHIFGATSAHPETIQTPTDMSPSLRKLTVFDKKYIMISNDLGLGSRIRQIIEDLISASGGSMTTTVYKADMYICRWREGRDYVYASQTNKDVGNLAWLYYLITHNQWTSPLRRLLHYPLPREGIPGFKEFRITLSNYGGDARVYLENLVIAAGGEFTKSMKQDNTHLITARQVSEKCDAAKEWNINMINHLWIEESYAKCQVQSLTDKRYTHFPPRTNLGEVIGQTRFDKSVLRSLYFSKEPTPSPSDPKFARKPMHEKDRNTPLNPRKSGEDDDMDENLADEEELPAVKLKKAVALPRSRASAGAQFSTPAPNRRISAGKENDTPSSTGSRSAKSEALNRLHGLAPDIALYEKEKKRKGPVWGGERAANRIEKEKSLEGDSSPLAKQYDEEYSGEEEPMPKRKKTTSHGGPPVQIRLMITGYKAWLGNPTKEDFDKKKLRDLGILVVHDPLTCTHLAAPAMVRTQKFLCALAAGPTIVSADFIETCVKDGEVPDVDNFLLKDKENEKKFKLKLQDAVSRARANKRHLLRRVPIYCTQEIPNEPSTYKAIVESNGGLFYEYKGRGGATIKPVSPEDDDGPAEPVYLLTGERPEEKRLWPKFTEMAKAGNMIPRIVRTEWLLDVAMSQQLKWNDSYMVKEYK